MLISGSKLGLALQMKKELKRRNAVEPVSGHLKTDSNLGRQDPCPLMRSRAQYSASSISISNPSLSASENACRAFWRLGLAFAAERLL